MSKVIDKPEACTVVVWAVERAVERAARSDTHHKGKSMTDICILMLDMVMISVNRLEIVVEGAHSMTVMLRRTEE